MSYDLSHVLSQYLERSGYERKDVSVIQPADIFLTRAGDIIIERLFSFERHGRLLALRPEFTSAAARQYASGHYTGPQRWFFSGPIFEDLSDTPFQNQRPSVGAEFLNATGVEADFEVMRTAVSGIQQTDLVNWKLVIGHAALQKHIMGQQGLDHHQYRLLLNQRERLKAEGMEAVETLLRSMVVESSDSPAKQIYSESSESSAQHMLDVLLDSTQYGSTMGSRTRKDIAQRILAKHERNQGLDVLLRGLQVFAEWTALRGSSAVILDAVANMLDPDDAAGQRYLDEWRKSIDLLIKSGIPDSQIILQPNLARNWEYYTGIVFGIEVDDTYVAAGGRYDDLATLINDDAVAIPAVGFSYYIDRLQEFLPEPEPQLVFEIIATAESIAAGQATADFLRSNGFSAILAITDENIGNNQVNVIQALTENEIAYQGITYPINNLDPLLTALGAITHDIQ